MLGDLTEKDLVVTGAVGIHGLAGWGCSNEVQSLSLQSFFLAVSYVEFFATLVILDLSRLSNLVGGLIVNEDSRRPCALEEALEYGLVLSVSEKLMSFILANTKHI